MVIKGYLFSISAPLSYNTHFLQTSPVSKHVIQIIVTSAVNECGFVARARVEDIVYSRVKCPRVFTHRYYYVTMSGD